MNVKKRKKYKVPQVPIIMQMEALECGAACLSMILAYHGTWVALEEVRLRCGISRDGSNARNILNAARQYGFDASGYRYELDAIQTMNSFPCILFWNFNHFVVLDGFKRNKAIINDPARGRIVLSMQEFDEAFTGVCLCFSPSPTFCRDGKKKSIWSFTKKKLQGAKTVLLFVALTTCISAFMSMVYPIFSRVFVDRIVSGLNPDWFTLFMIGISVLCIVDLSAQWIQAIYFKKLEGKLAISANAQFMWHVLRLPLEFFAQRMIGDIALRKASNEGVAKSLVETLAPLVLHTLMMVFYLLIMLRFEARLALIGLIGVGINVWLSNVIAKQRMNVSRVMVKDQGMLWSTTIAGMELMESIKASGCEQGFFERWAGYQANVNHQSVRNASIDTYIGQIPEMVLQLSNLILLGLGVYLIMTGSFTLGMLLAFQGFMSAFLAPAQALMKAGQTIQEMRVNMERIEDVLEYPTDIMYKGGEEDTTYQKLQGKIELRNVTFGYSRLEPPLIENFSMTLMPGKKVAFVGGSGCGKSTLAKLISGLYQPWSGEILFDDIAMQNIDHRVVTSSIAVVDQDITLFEDTIEANIKMWDSSIADFEMILAARDADIHSTILQREGGFQYRLLQGGKEFSGGQRQRLEIARVLAQDPTIMIMDEATSALDAKTEYEVAQSIQARGITCIMIAHRLSTIRDCDEIIVLQHGQVVERGTHEELYARNGFYTTLLACE